jgi:AcrR family transcriptional regulator
MTTPDLRRYESPLRQAQAEATRTRILDAVERLLTEAPDGALGFEEVAEAAGTDRRTVFRHFPNKEALLAAFWDRVNDRLGPGTFPNRPEDLLAAPRTVFPGFDAAEGVMRASLHSRGGREMRLARREQRRAAFRAALAPLLATLAPAEARRFEAVVQVLYSAAAWETFRDYAGMDGAEAGETAAWALETLAAALRAGPAAPDDPPST